MIVSRSAVDYQTLPNELLVAAKAWMRVDHADDDDLILSHLAMAMSHLERISDLSLFAAEYDVTPTPFDRPRGPCPPYYGPQGSPYAALVRLPHHPVTDLELVDEADVATPYAGTLVTEDPDYGPTWVEYATGANHYRYVAGYNAAADLSPAVIQYVMRLAASLYENREASVDIITDDFTAEFLPLWRPSA